MINKIIKSVVNGLSFIFEKIKSFFIQIKKILAFLFNKVGEFFVFLGKKLSKIQFLKKLSAFFNKIFYPIGNFVKKIFAHLEGWEKIVIIILIIVIIVCASFLGYRNYASQAQIVPVVGGEYWEGEVGEPKYMNPVLCQTNKVDAAICSLVFSGLTKFNQKRIIIPDLAQKWEQSVDGKTYTFIIKNNAYWHDGKPVTADDIIFTTTVIIDPDYQGTLGKVWRDVKVEKINDKTVKFTLNNSSTTFLENTTIGILPKHILGGIPVKNLNLHTFNLNPIGTGPYMFDRVDFNNFGGFQSVILKRNDKYYANKANISKINLSFYPDEISLLEAYKEREIFGIDSIKAEQSADLSKWKNFSLYRAPLPEYNALFINTKKPYLDNKDIRKALAYSTNKDEIIKKAIYNEAQLVDGPILPEFFGYNKDIVKYSYDPKKAISIFEQLGYKKNEEGILEKDKKKFELGLTTVDSNQNKKIAEIIKRQWKEVGVNLKINIIDSNTLQRDYIRPRNYEILLFGESLGANPDVFPYWHSTEINDPGLNLSSYDNKEVDRCLEDARQTTDINVRKQKYIDFQNMIADDVPAIFLYSPNYIFGVSNKIKGVSLGLIITPADRFNDITNWYINYIRKK